MSAKIYKVCRIHGKLTRKQVSIVGIKRVVIRCLQCRKAYNTEYRNRPYVKKLLHANSHRYNSSIISQLKEPYLKELCVEAYKLKGRKYVTTKMILKMRKQVIDRRLRLASLL